MDVSLDDYISKSNFRVQIGNPKAANVKQIGGFQGGRKAAGRFTSQAVTDVSITVPGVRKQDGYQSNKTNQVRDAREKLSIKSKVGDAREKLNKKAQSTDARQKLLTIRAQKGQVTPGAVDARVTLQAKRQQQGGLNFTRTVGNAAAQAPTASTQGPGPVQITRTLSRVMPPGYEELAAPNVKPTISLQTGEPPGQITRTVNQSPKTIFRTVTGNPPTQPPPLIPQQRFAPQPGQAPYPSNVVYTTQPAPPPQVFYEHPPPRAPPQYPYPPPPQPLLQQAPPPHVQYVPQVVTAPYPPSPGQPFIAPPPQTVAPPPGGPPYPVESNIQITRTIEQQIGGAPTGQRPDLPVIHVRNDQYQPPQPAQPVPLYPPRDKSYVSSEPDELSYYTSSRSLKKTVKNESPQISDYEPTLKRKVPVGGPLKLSHTNTNPVIEAPSGSSSDNTSKYLKITTSEPAVKKVKEEASVSTEDVISPLQGYKIVVTNLHPNVTQDDIIELFGAVGAVKRVKLVKPGLADVVYVKSDDAVTAAKTYHNRELDGLPMVVKMSTPATAKVIEAPEKLPPNAKPVSSGPLKLSKKPAGMAKVSEKKSVDVTTLHKALFKIGSASTSKPVTFTVNI